MSDKYPNDAELQRIIAKLHAEKSERLKNLYELLNYRDKDAESEYA